MTGVPFRLALIGLSDVLLSLAGSEKKLEPAGLEKPMEKAIKLVTTELQTRVPVDTGNLKNSFESEVVKRGREVQGISGTPVTYAPVVNDGAGPFRPPVAAVQGWADRHGVSAGAVVAAVARRGLPARRYIEDTIDATQEEVEQIIGDHVAEVVREWL